MKCILVVQAGTEVDDRTPVNQVNKGGSSFKSKFKFKQSGKTTQTSSQVWTDKYELLRKSNGWGGLGERGLKTGVRGKQLHWNYRVSLGGAT